MLWEGWPASASTWEPASFVIDDLLETFDNPPVSEDRRAEGLQTLYFSFQHALSGSTNQAAGHDVPLRLDVFRAITHLATSTPSAIQGYNAYSKAEFGKIGLPVHWDHLVKENGIGRKIQFPILIRQVVKWTKVNYAIENGHQVTIPPEPMECVRVRVCTSAFSL